MNADTGRFRDRIGKDSFWIHASGSGAKAEGCRGECDTFQFDGEGIGREGFAETIHPRLRQSDCGQAGQESGGKREKKEKCEGEPIAAVATGTMFCQAFFRDFPNAVKRN